MENRRTVEIFGAGCPACEEVVHLVERLACESCDVRVLDMNEAEVASRAQELGIARIPSVVIDGQLASCCRGGGPTESGLREAGLGQPIP